tara:strand:+ start:6504 stop:7109 length:606 start_codon:yes stop_codon:yes gene_type:complete
MKTRSLVGSGVFAAVAASLCCITPVLAMVAGVSGMASTFSWIEPSRPYFMGFTVLVLGFAWYQKLSPKTSKDMECDCEDDKRPKFWQSKTFIGIVTIFAALMLAFPYYADVFYPSNENKQIVIVNENDIHRVSFTIDGMTCNGCAVHVKGEINKLPGIVSVEASYEKGNAEVEFDASKVSAKDIKEAIDATGYTVTGMKEQ